MRLFKSLTRLAAEGLADQIVKMVSKVVSKTCSYRLAERGPNVISGGFSADTSSMTPLRSYVIL